MRQREPFAAVAATAAALAGAAAIVAEAAAEALAQLSVAALAAAAIAFALAVAEIAVAIADDAAAPRAPCSLVISPALGLGGVKRVTKPTPLTAWSAPQVIRPRLFKYLAAFCMLDCVCAATLPSSSTPKFEADVPDPSDKTTVLARHAFATLGPLHIALTLALWPQPPISVPGLWALRA